MKSLPATVRNRFRQSDGSRVIQTAESRLAWRSVMSAGSKAGVLDILVQKLREKGVAPADFDESRRAREITADALTRIQDHLEGLRDSGLKRDRIAAVMTVRRRLELELWP